MVVLLEFERGLSRALVVENLAEHVDFPADADGERVGPAHRAVGVAGSGSVGRESHGGEIAQLGAQKVGAGHVDVQTGIFKVGVVGKSTVDIVLEQGVGEYLLPAQIAQGGRVYFGVAGLDIAAGQVGVGRHVELVVDMTRRHHGRSQQRGCAQAHYSGCFHLDI